MRKKHEFRDLDRDNMENLLSGFLLDSWSYSKISEFSRNEKSFEMSHVYGYRHRRSASSVAGSAYHYALDHYFTGIQESVELDIVDLENTAFNYMDAIKGDEWKLQKTTPDVFKCREKANKLVTQLLQNFVGELSAYTDDIKEVLSVELYCDEFLTINGVDIPIPCHAKIDLVVRTKKN